MLSRIRHRGREGHFGAWLCGPRHSLVEIRPTPSCRLGMAAIAGCSCEARWRAAAECGGPEIAPPRKNADTPETGDSVRELVLEKDARESSYRAHPPGGAARPPPAVPREPWPV